MRSRTDRSCLGAGRRTDRRSGSAPDLRVQALPTVAKRPSESVLLRFTELFRPLSSIWNFFHTGTGSHRADVPICGPWANTTSEPRRSFSVPAHTLHEQVGDLVLKGDASSTTKVYLEALGLPIAFHGTSIPAPTWVQLPQHLVFALLVFSQNVGVTFDVRTVDSPSCTFGLL